MLEHAGGNQGCSSALGARDLLGHAPRHRPNGRHLSTLQSEVQPIARRKSTISRRSVRCPGAWRLAQLGGETGRRVIWSQAGSGRQADPRGQMTVCLGLSAGAQADRSPARLPRRTRCPLDPASRSRSPYRGATGSRTRSLHGPTGVCVRSSKYEPKKEARVDRAAIRVASDEATSSSSGRRSTWVGAPSVTPASAAENRRSATSTSARPPRVARTVPSKNEPAPTKRAVNSVPGER